MAKDRNERSGWELARMMCPRWCRTADLAGTAPADRHEAHLATGPEGYLDELRLADEDRTLRRGGGAWYLALSKPAASASPASASIIGLTSRDAEGHESFLALLSSECRSLAAALVWAADRLELDEFPM